MMTMTIVLQDNHDDDMNIEEPASSKEVDDGDDQLLLAELLSLPLHLHQVPVDQVPCIGNKWFSFW